MIKRAILLLVLLVPTATFADDSSQLQNPQSSGSSTGSSSLLQPAGGTDSPLQPTGDSSGGSSQSASDSLQQTGSGDAVKVLIQGDVDSPKTPDKDAPDLTWLNYILLIAVISTIATGVAVYVQGRPQQKSK